MGRGTGTANIEDKLLQKLINMIETVLHSILLDLRKAYDALDRDRCLGILAGYGVGPSTLQIMRKYWAWIHMAAKVGGVTGPYSRSTEGKTRGSPFHPQYLTWPLTLLSETG